MNQGAPTVVEMQTQRLRLRAVRHADAAALFAIHSDAQAMRYFGADPASSLEDAHGLVARFDAMRHSDMPGLRWAIEDGETGALLGTCGLFNHSKRWRKCMVGYELARSAWGRGVMSEAVSAVLTWGFDAWSLNRIEALIHPLNAASLKLVQKFGFQLEGTARQIAYWGQAYHDMQQWSLLRSEFLPKHSFSISTGVLS